jgi:hypothetical protein
VVIGTSIALIFSNSTGLMLREDLREELTLAMMEEKMGEDHMRSDAFQRQQTGQADDFTFDGSGSSRLKRIILLAR